MLVSKKKNELVYELRRKAPAAKTRKWRRKETSGAALLEAVVLSGLLVLLVVPLDWGVKKVPTVDLRKFE